MGIVYKAEDKKLLRTVALKLLPAHLTEHKDRFLREAQAAAALNHVNICTIHEIDEAHPFIAMEFLEGVTLKDRIAQRPLPLNEALAIAIQACQGLQHAHEKGVVHRDIKPANVMITPQGQVKIMDFGLAHVGDRTRLTKTGSSIGTPAYMSPEQVTGEIADRRTDIWSLGVTLHEMLTGRLPFAGDNDAALAYGIVHTRPEPVTSLRSGLPVELDRILAKALAKRPVERFQHMADLATNLAALASGAPLGSSPPATRRYWFWGSTGFAAASAAYFAWTRYDRPAAPPKNPMTARNPSPKQQANSDFERANVSLRLQFDVLRARELLEHAIALDPQFVEAISFYTLTHLLLIEAGLSNDSALLLRAEAEAQQMIRQHSLAVSYGTLAAAYYHQGRKHLIPSAAKMALRLDPDHNSGPVWLSRFHLLSGSYTEAIQLLNGVLAREPLFFVARVHIADALRQQGQYKAALQEIDRVLDQDRENFHGLTVAAFIQLDQGELATAAATLDKFRESNRGSYIVRLLRALLLALQGQRTKALAMMDSEVLKFAQFVQWNILAAEFYAILGDQPRAIEWLELAVRNGDERVAWFQRDPLLANLRTNPRFQQLLSVIQQRQKSQ